MQRLILTLSFLFTPWTALAQTNVSGVVGNEDQPIEVTAQEMTVNQATNIAILRGDVVIVQGDMRLAAPSVDVHYSDEDEITYILATGGATIVTPTETAEGDIAEYFLTEDSLILTGDAFISQDRILSNADRIVIDMETGDADLEGNVRSVLQPKKN